MRHLGRSNVCRSLGVGYITMSLTAAMSPPSRVLRIETAESPLQILPEAPHKTDLDEPERAVGGGTDLVVRLRVRRKFTAALRMSPLLRRHDQRPADAAATSLRHDEPSLEVRYTVAPAALGVPANRELGESDRAPCAILSEEDCERLPRVARKEAVDVFTVLGFGALGPKGAAQLEPRGSVPRLGGSNSDH